MSVKVHLKIQMPQTPMGEKDGVKLGNLISSFYRIKSGLYKLRAIWVLSEQY